mmetsp:Transcript_22744/g.65542  ORF Transcript_22744/g.65542 Transcript_22744/m.65542 type:complete len:527 (+) Transcript_22744:71-1651(+)
MAFVRGGDASDEGIATVAAGGHVPESGTPGDRVLELLHRMEADADALRKEHNRLASERDRWMPCIGSIHNPAESRALPSRCRVHVVEASEHERRARAASRSLQLAESIAQRTRGQQAVLEEATANAIEKAEQTRRSAELRLEEVHAERRRAEASHIERLASAETANTQDIEAIGRRIEQTRTASDDNARRMRREVVQERERCKREIALLQESFEKRFADLETAVRHHAEDTCNTMSEIARQCEEARRAAEQRWCSGREEAESHHADARELSERHTQEKDNHAVQTRQHQDEVEARLTSELRELAEAEETMRKDVTAEQHLERRLAEIADWLANRALRSEEVRRTSSLEVQALKDQAMADGKHAVARLASAHSGVDAEIEAFCKEVLALDCGRITEKQARLTTATQQARELFTAQLMALQLDAQRHRESLGAALASADQRVQELRSTVHDRTDKYLRATSENVRGIHQERMRIAASAEAQVRYAQHQIVKFVDGQREEMLACLGFHGAATAKLLDKPAGIMVPQAPC